MTKLSGKEIQKLARSIVTENPGGIRSELPAIALTAEIETDRKFSHRSFGHAKRD